jgi:hypothetical protein
VQDIYELSPLQQGMLLHSVHDGAADMYLGQHVYTIDGPLDGDAMIAAWQVVFSAHPALRTSFHWAGLEKPLQVVHRDVSPPAHRHDWSDLTEPEQRERTQRLLAEDQAQGFDLSVAPLQRLYLVRLGPERHGLIWSHHHLLLDGWSVPIFMNEVMAHYASRTGGHRSAPPPARPYRDYIAWLRGQDRAAAEKFWIETLAGFRPGRLVPLHRADLRHGTGATDRHTLPMPATLEQGLPAAAARHRVALSALVHAAWAVFLRRYSGMSTVSFGAVTSGRPPELPGVDRMVGLFANTLPVPVTVPDHGDLGPWLRELQDRSAAIRRYEFSPLSDIKKWAGVPGAQLFESLVVLANYSFGVDGDGTAALSVRSDAIYDKVSVPLSLIIVPQPVSEIQLVVHRNRFDPGFPDEALACVRRILETLIDADHIQQLTAAAGPPVTPPDPDTLEPAGPSTPPQTELEHTIAEVYRDLLGLDDIDVTRSFFDLGGDSFGAVRAIGRIDGATIALLAAHPSVRELATALAATTDESDAELDGEIAELERQIAEHADLERRLAEKRAARQIGP